MAWTKLWFGKKHKGKTLPQIMFKDPDWFFWAIEKGVFKNKGKLGEEAWEIYQKARKIKIPRNIKLPLNFYEDELVAEYPSPEFCEILQARKF